MAAVIILPKINEAKVPAQMWEMTFPGPCLTGKLVTFKGFWERASLFSEGVATDRILMLQWLVHTHAHMGAIN